MTSLTTPRPIFASLVASAAWLGPWIILILFESRCDNDAAVACGLFLVAIPIALGFGALIWRTIGALLRNGPPPLRRFTIRGTLLAMGFALAFELWKLWGIWDAPPPVRYGESITMGLINTGALGLTALPAAALWWWLAIRPAIATVSMAESEGAPGS